MKIRLYENLRTVSYAPFYLAEADEAYIANGLDVETVTSPQPAETALGVIAGRVDVAWGGPMRVLMHHDADPDCPLVCFGQVVARDPFMLLGAQPRPGFRFSDLIGKRIGVVSEVPTPWMTMQDDVARAGVDPSALMIGPERSMAENVVALSRAELDVIQVMEPYATCAIDDGVAHLWHRFSERGAVAFTTFYATRAFVEAQTETCRALVRAVSCSVQTLYRSDANEVAERIAAWFPALPHRLLAQAIAGYQAAAIWHEQPTIAVDHLVRLKAALLSGGLIARDVPYCAVVDDRFAAL